MEKRRGKGITWIRIRIMSTLGLGSEINRMARAFRNSEMDRTIKETSKMESRKVTATMSVNLAFIRETSRTETSVVKARLATQTAAPIKVNGAKECSQVTVSSHGPMETAIKANIQKV